MKKIQNNYYQRENARKYLDNYYQRENAGKYLDNYYQKGEEHHEKREKGAYMEQSI